MTAHPKADQYWRDLCEGLARASEVIAGYGRLEAEIVFHAGVPVDLHVHERVQHYKLGDTKPPLTGRSPLVTLGTTTE